MKILIYQSGTHHKNLIGFKIGCSKLGYNFTDSKDSRELVKEWDFVWIPTGYILPTDIPNAKRIMYGPQNFVFPCNPWFNQGVFDNRCFYNCLSDLILGIFGEFGTMGLPCMALPFGVDTESFSKKSVPETYEYDCFLYFKHRNPNHLQKMLALCAKKDLKVKVLQYGSYKEEEYKDILRKSRFGIWIGSHESQGFALQEALSTNTPLLVWNVTSMFDEMNGSSMVYAHHLGSKQLLATSCTTWDDTCGIQFINEENAEACLDQMIERWKTFQPRDLIIKTLDPATCLNNMIYGNKKEIVPWLLGGLGNQMFVLAAAWIGSKIHKCKLAIFNYETSHNTLKNNYKGTIFKYFEKHIDVQQSDNLTNYLLNNGYTIFKQSTGGFCHYNPKDCSSQSIFKDYFQFYQPIASYENELRELFLQGLGDLRNRIVTDFGSLESSAFLHVRRGDYLNNPHIHTIQPISYYETALSILPASVENIFIFSNDINFLKEQPFFSSDNRFKIIEDPNELYNLAFMSLCRGGAICANSTFSWWGAFLGTYSKRNPVIIPKDWIRIGEDFSGLFPPEWIQI